MNYCGTSRKCRLFDETLQTYVDARPFANMSAIVLASGVSRLCDSYTRLLGIIRLLIADCRVSPLFRDYFGSKNVDNANYFDPALSLLLRGLCMDFGKKVLIFVFPLIYLKFICSDKYQDLCDTQLSHRQHNVFRIGFMPCISLQIALRDYRTTNQSITVEASHSYPYLPF